MQLTLDGVVYQIKRVPRATIDPRLRADAEIDYATQTILVREDAGPQAFWILLGHELTHHWLEWSGLSTLFKPKQVEAICDAVGRGLADMLTRNQHLLWGSWGVEDEAKPQ